MTTLEKIAKKISGHRGSKLDKARYLNAWIYGSLALSVKDREDDSVAQTLKHMNGSCGHRDNLFREVATLLGWKSRRVGFHEVPIQLAHVGTEVRINGKWHFFDPTFGIYLATIEAPEAVLSIEDARKSYPNVKVFYTNQPPYLGKSLRKADKTYTPLTEDILIHPSGDWPLASIDGTYFLSKLIIEAEGKHYISEITIPIQQGDVFTFDEEALAKGHLAFNYGETYVGYAQILGKYWGRGPIVSKRISFLTTSPLNMHISMQLRHAPMENVYANMRHTTSNYELKATQITKNTQDNIISWEFIITPPMTIFNVRVSHDDSAVIENLTIRATAL
ncbi:MAG: transglutaminase domain-containing protein [Robiginitomaculum sp.]|nr:transglutaminase domain-containing protein [Robiginitomaculum sp.]